MKGPKASLLLYLNAKGGIGGRKIKLVYRDTNDRDSLQLGKELLANKNIKAVIGPSSSEELFKLAPLFIKYRKILISDSLSAVHRKYTGLAIILDLFHIF